MVFSFILLKHYPLVIGRYAYSQLILALFRYLGMTFYGVKMDPKTTKKLKTEKRKEKVSSLTEFNLLKQ